MWLEGEADRRTTQLINSILQHYGIDDTMLEAVFYVSSGMSNICKYFQHLWVKHNYTRENVLRKTDYFSRTFSLPADILQTMPSTSTSVPQRTKKPFDQSSDCVKRRKTYDLRENYDANTLAYATQMKLRSEGRKDAAAIVKEVIQTTPTRASKMKSLWKSPPSEPVPYTPEEAVALIINRNFSRSQYEGLRSDGIERNAGIYSPYYKVLAAKQKCYPNAISVTETKAEVDLQELLNHTSRRLLETGTKIIADLSDIELLNITIVYKWGFDGSSDHKVFNQKYTNNADSSDSHMFLTSIVPIRVEVAGKYIFENPTPSSTRYCRPWRMQFLKETIDLLATERRYCEDKIRQLTPFEVMINGRRTKISFKMHLTMLDGKAVNAITSTSSMQRCNICGATPKQMNNLSLVCIFR